MDQTKDYEVGPNIIFLPIPSPFITRLVDRLGFKMLSLVMKAMFLSLEKAESLDS